MEPVTQVDFGDPIMFILVGQTAFAARRWETRQLLPPEAVESDPV